MLLVQVSAMGMHLGKGAEAGEYMSSARTVRKSRLDTLGNTTAMKDEMERRREGFETVVG